MKKRTVKILGEEIDITFCMAVEISYEEISQEPFEIDKIDNRKKMLILDYAAILTAAPETKITFDRLIKEAKPSEINILSQAVCDAMEEWYEIPSVMEEHPNKDEDGEKN